MPFLRSLPSLSRRRTGRYRPVASTPIFVAISATVMPGCSAVIARICSARSERRGLVAALRLRLRRVGLAVDAAPAPLLDDLRPARRERLRERVAALVVAAAAGL